MLLFLYASLWSLCAPLRRFIRVHQRVKTEKKFSFGVLIESVVNPSARFLSLKRKKNLLLYFGYSIQSNATAAPPTRWKLEEFPKADLHHANKIQHQMWKYRMNRTYKRTERTESMDESLTRSNARNSNLKSQREKNHNYKAREKKKKLCVSNEYYVLSNLGSVILLSYIQTLIRIKQHRLLLGVCVCVSILCVWIKAEKITTPTTLPLCTQFLYTRVM